MRFFENEDDFGYCLKEAIQGSRASQGRIKDVILDLRNGKANFQEALVADQTITQWFNQTIAPAYEQAYAELPDITEGISSEKKMNDFRPTQLLELLPTQAGLTENAGRKIPEGTLPHIPELTPYPTFGYKARGRWVEGPGKHGMRIQFSWESFINDNWDALGRFPEDAARMTRKTKEAMVIGLLMSLDPATPGFNPAVISDALGTTLKARNADNQTIFSNVAKNAPLSFDAINAAIRQVAESRDAWGNPVSVSNFTLIVPTSLEPVANLMLSASGIERGFTGANGDTLKFTLAAGIAANVKVVGTDLLTTLGGSAQGATNWILVPTGGKTNNGRETLLRTSLLGYEQPDLRVSNVTGTYLGGGAVPSTEGSFDNDDSRARVRYVCGGAVVNLDGIVASTGRGA